MRGACPSFEIVAMRQQFCALAVPSQAEQDRCAFELSSCSATTCPIVEGNAHDSRHWHLKCELPHVKKYSQVKVRRRF